MLFNSYIFIFIFLPAVFFIYFGLILNKKNYLAKCWLVIASLFFYGWWNIYFLPILIVSILVNFSITRKIQSLKKNKNDAKPRKIFFLAGLLFNIAFLGYFKYRDFFLETINQIFQSDFVLLHLVFPLGISFFTLQQIAFLVDAYEDLADEPNFIDYSVFVAFFPQLIAGPIVHHQEMMPQFSAFQNQRVDYKNITQGVLIFFIGLFKKVVIADTFAGWATTGFDDATTLTFIEAWATSLSFTFQLYFDFSAYSDMAVGIALLFNIKLPNNFNSPYKALNIRDFWRRWHMTLGRFLKDYIYIPLGGNRLGSFRLHINLIATFLLCGLWHGAGWIFIFWGALHGIALVTYQFWSQMNIKMHYFLAGTLTFLFVNFSWIFFRAKEWKDATKILAGMLGFNGIGILNLTPIIYIVFFLGVVWKAKNSLQWAEQINNRSRAVYIALFLGTFAILQLNNFQISNDNTMEFIYFNF